MIDYNELAKNKIKEYTEEEKTKVVKSIWEEEPVDFKTFVESPDYAHSNVPLSTVQYYEIERISGTDPKEVFKMGRPTIEAVSEWGKGCLFKNTEIKDVITGKHYTVQKWSELNEGINLYVLDESTNKVIITKSGIPFKKGKDTIYKIVLDNHYGWGKSTLLVTKEHRFMTSNREWKKLSELSIGDSLIWLDPSKLAWSKDGGTRARIVSENGKKLSIRLSPEERKQLFGSPGEKHPRYGKHWTDEKKKEISTSMQKSDKFWKAVERNKQDDKYAVRGEKNGMYGKHPPKGSGRCKTIDYVSPKAGNIYLQGSYELRLAKILDYLDEVVYWERGGFFKYFHPEKKFMATYFPDFRVVFNDGYECYYETKGYVQDIDFVKIEAVRSQGKHIVLVNSECLDTIEITKVLPRNDSKWLSVSNILSIEEVGYDDYYDLEIPEYHNYFLKGFLNHNSGKGTTFTLFETYCFYLHLCMKDPHSYYKIARADPISAITVATSATQSTDIFNRFLNRILENEWFARRYLIRSEGRVRSDPKDFGGYAEDEILLTSHSFLQDDEIKAGARTIKFPKNLEAIAASCRTTGYEHLTMFFGLFDEASGFTTKDGYYNAEDIYNLLGMTTRNLPAFLIMTSWPRLDKDNDFIHIKCEEFLQKEKESRAKGEQPTKFASRYTTWEVLPEQYPDLVEIEIDTRTGEKAKVPKNLLPKFDPEAPAAFSEAKRKYMCIPGGVLEHGYEDDPDKIRQCVKEYMPNIQTHVTIETKGTVYYSKNMITRLSLNKKFTYYIGLDQGQERAETVLWVGHVERPAEFNNQPMIVVDGAIVYPTIIPNGKRRCSVDLDDVITILKHICEAVPVGMVRCDHWNAGILSMKLRELGVKIVLKECGRAEYDMAKDLMHKQRVVFPKGPYTEQFIRQWSILISSETSTTKKPKVAADLQDSVDAFVELMQAIKEAFATPDDLTVGVIQSQASWLKTRLPNQLPEERKPQANEAGLLFGPGGVHIQTDKKLPNSNRRW